MTKKARLVLKDKEGLLRDVMIAESFKIELSTSNVNQIISLETWVEAGKPTSTVLRITKPKTVRGEHNALLIIFKNKEEQQ